MRLNQSQLDGWGWSLRGNKPNNLRRDQRRIAKGGANPTKFADFATILDPSHFIKCCATRKRRHAHPIPTIWLTVLTQHVIQIRALGIPIFAWKRRNLID
ncbi:hypothetical protein niasHT_028913 [Heterodera trifolii]|uniref:Uncharacterized protein n=1 Tax=Heterodera trifolii TaxID=157864 RepID=A0ABD2KGC8_9BILA